MADRNFAKRGARVHGIDISSEAIHIARRTAVANEVEERVRFTVGSAYELDSPDNYFDVIAGQAILHHVADKSRVASELYRVLKPGGKAVFFECFGDSRMLERLRLTIPVPGEEEDETHQDEQIKYEDLETFRRLFTVSWKEFQLFSRLDRITE